MPYFARLSLDGAVCQRLLSPRWAQQLSFRFINCFTWRESQKRVTKMHASLDAIQLAALRG